ncbi:MAG: sulfurtransferase TusA family protein [ANME-2 cluster archaeon]|nr:sulfurtransferase TusA family protein [ANME-2 cluster archaeon]
MEKLDTRGRICPIPLFHTKRKLEELSSGDMLEVIADDKTARETIPQWCRMHDHTIVSSKETEDHFIITIRKS